MRALAEGLRRAMVDADYTVLRTLAGDAQLAASTVSNALSGKTVPSWRTTQFLLQTCGIQPNAHWRKVWEAARDAEQPPDALPQDDEPRQEPDTVRSHQPGLFSIRPPVGSLPARVRGRAAIVSRLTTLVAKPRPMLQVLHGLGGCGKTTIALEVARLVQESGHPVYWVSAAERGGFVASMRQVAREIGIPAGDIEQAWSGRSSAMDMLWRHLDSAQQPWLLIVDNADVPEVLASPGRIAGDGTGWVRPSRSGTTILTSRVGTPATWGSQAERHHVGVLGEKDAADVLVDLAGHAGDKEEANALAERLGGLPLALRSAGSYLSRTARGAGLLRRPARITTFDAYRLALGNLGTELLDEGQPWPNESERLERLHRGLVGRTWEMSLDLLEAQGIAQARPLMRLISCFAPAPLPVELIAEDESYLPSLEQLDRALEALVDLDMLTVTRTSPSADDSAQSTCLVGHRLVLEATASRLRELPAAEQAITWRAAARLITVAGAPAPEEPQNWDWWRLILPHVATLVSVIPSNDSSVLIEALHQGLRGYAYMSFSSTFDGATTYSQMLLDRSLTLPDSHPVRLAARHRELLASSRPAADLAREYEDVLSRQVTVLGPDHPDTLITDHQLATVLAETHGKIASLREIRRVAERRAILFGPANPYTLVSQDELVDLLISLDHKDEAEALLRTVVEDCERFLGPTNHYTLMWTMKLTRELINQGRVDVDLDEMLQGHNRQATPLAAQVEIARVLALLERHTEAELEYKTILERLQATGQERTGRYRQALRSLCFSLHEQGRLKEAFELHSNAIRNCGHSDDLRIYNLRLRLDHVELHTWAKQWDEAEGELRKLLSDLTLTATSDPTLELDVRRKLTFVLAAQDKDAATEREEAVLAELCEQSFGATYWRTRRALWNHAQSLKLLGRNRAALKVYRKCLQVEEIIFPANHDDITATRTRIVEMRLKIGEMSADQAVSEFFAIPWKDAQTRDSRYLQLASAVATARRLNGDADGALEALTELEEQYRQQDSPGHESLLTVLRSISSLLIDLERPRDALDKCYEYRKLLENKHEQDASRKLFAARRIVNLQLMLGEISNEEALGKIESLLSEYSEEFAPFSDRILHLRRRIALLQHAMGEIDRAEIELRYIVTVCQMRREPEDAIHRIATWNLSVLLMDHGRFDEALPLLEGCLAAERATYEEADNRDILRTRRRIAWCRRELNVASIVDTIAEYTDILKGLILHDGENGTLPTAIRNALHELKGTPSKHSPLTH
ncbi:NB-ARC domain-containing protein [Amycolatopsis xylanica]